ncbi:concanavalin A-like lectin/glucanase domain-containing protein [Phyllosticta citricarpa]|uniref:Concanavalin A-like lectin/glucanase domain-containing protein n=2 Tax=Phyllosticta TaxID=121621 RepID=A0ABR1MLF3_9PEZI
MSFSKQLDGFLNKAKGKIEKYQADRNSSSSGAYNRPPPPAPNPSGFGYGSAHGYPSAAPHFFPGSHPPAGPLPPPQQQWGPPGAPPPLPPHPSGPPFYWRPAFSPHEPVSAHFHHQLGDNGWGNNEAQNYTSAPHNSFHTPSNALVLRAIANRSAPPGHQYTSARLTSHTTLSRDRGFLLARITAPCARGVWPAFWLLPREPFTWPVDGEADIFEAWNGDRVNHSCLHWGHFNGEDWNKHRVVETPIPALDHPEGCWYGFAWDQPPDGRGGRLVWYIDGRPVMKAHVPEGTRRVSDWQIILNVAMGGNVCQGILPEDGAYDMVVHNLKLCEEPVGGWGCFERDWHTAPEGHTM